MFVREFFNNGLPIRFSHQYCSASVKTNNKIFLTYIIYTFSLFFY